MNSDLSSQTKAGDKVTALQTFYAIVVRVKSGPDFVIQRA